MRARPPALPAWFVPPGSAGRRPASLPPDGLAGECGRGRPRSRPGSSPLGSAGRRPAFLPPDGLLGNAGEAARAPGLVRPPLGARAAGPHSCHRTVCWGMRARPPALPAWFVPPWERGPPARILATGRLAGECGRGRRRSRPGSSPLGARAAGPHPCRRTVCWGMRARPPALPVPSSLMLAAPEVARRKTP